MDGTITRKDIITDDALRWGDEYAKTLNEAIAKNKEFVDSIILLNAENVKLRRSENQTEFIKQKNEVKLLAEKSIVTLKEQQIAETNLEKVKQESLKTEKLALDIAAKKNAATKSNIKLSVEERLANEQNNRLAKEQAILNSKMTTAYTKLNLERTIAKRTLLDLLSAETQNTEAIKKAEIEFAKLDVRVRKADQAVGDFHKSVGNYPKIANLTSGIKNLMGAFGVLGGLSLFASMMKGAYDTMVKFDQGLADLSAITGAAGKDLEYLKNQAIELGKGTKGGAVAVVEAYKLIASAKPELLENVQALNQVTAAVLTLSQAAGMEMPDAATALTDAMNQFNAPASDAAKYVDVLAAGAKYGAAEIPQLTEAILKFGAVAKVSNVDIKESTALVELLAEKGLKGAEAGTAIKNILLEINSGFTTKEARAELDRYGISFEKLKDKTIPFADKLEMLKPLLTDTTSIVNTFKKENSAAAISLISNTERLKELTAQVGEFGVAEQQAAIRMDTLQGKTEKLSSTYDSFILSINGGKGIVSDFFKFFIDGTTGALKGLIRMNDTWQEIYGKAAARGADLGEKDFDKRMHSAGFITSTDAEKALMVLEKAEAEYSELLKRKNKNNKEIAEFNPYAINFGKSGKDLKKEQEQLVLDIAAREAIIRKAKAKLQTTKTGNIAGGTGATTVIAETPEEKSAREKSAKEALDRAKKLSDSLYELQKQSLERTIKINSEIASDDKMNDDVRIKALELVQQKEIALAELTKKHSLDADKFVTAENKLNANQKLIIANEAANKIVDINKKTADEILKINQFDEAAYQKDLENKVSKVNVAMNAELQAENERFASLGDLEAMAQADREKAIEDHERKIFEIKKAFAIKTLKLQISNLEAELAASDLLPANEQLSADKRQKIAETLSKAKLDLSEVEVSTSKETSDKIVMTEAEKTEKILEMSSALTGALTDLGNALFERKIQNIEEEIDKNNEYYDKQIELAGNDERQKDLLNKEREKKNDELEKKKRKEQHKQAVFNKATALAQAGISTSLAILAALNTQPFLPLGPAMATLAGVLGAIQIGAIIATPIPKYKDGRKGGPAETAWVGDGGVSEVITNPKTLNARLTPNIPTLTHLNEGDIVHKSMADYQAYMRASILSGLKMDSHRLNDFQAMQNEEKYGKEMLEELKRNTRAIEKQKNGSTINMPKLDINHHLWKMRNTNWN